jgi:hypothetical protein
MAKQRVHAPMEEFLEAVFYVMSVPKLSSKDQLSQGAWRQDELIAGKQQVVN